MKLTKAHDCDLCKKPAAEMPVVYDAQCKIQGRVTWAWCCHACWEYYNAAGGKLGTGIGQKFENKEMGRKLAG